MTDIFISEVNSNAEGGDFFELYNYGTTNIDMSGWRWTDSEADPEKIVTFPADTILAAGQRMIVVSGTDAAGFRAGWDLPDDLTIIALGGPGLGKGDAVVILDGDNTLVTAFNFGPDFSATDTLGSNVASSLKSGGGAAVGGHAGPAFGGGNDSISAVWDGVSTSAPAYTYAVDGMLGAHAHTTDSASVGSPGIADMAPPKVLITEVNSNAEGGDFFELYNYGDTAIDLSGWKFIDDKADPNHEDAREITGITELAAGAKLIVVTDSTDADAFRAAWGIDDGVQVFAAATEGPGLGGNDAVVVFDAHGRVAAALNYKTTAITTEPDHIVIAPVARTDGSPVATGHAGEAVGATSGDKGVSAVWDGIDPTNPTYHAALADQDGAFAQPDEAANIGSPGAVRATPTVMITEVNSNAEGGDFFELYNYGNAEIDMTGWRWVDSGGAGSDIITFPDHTTLAAGERLIVVSDTDEAGFRAGWDLPEDLTVIALGGAGLGKADGVVVVDADNGLVAGFNYGTANFTAPLSMGAHVIAPSTNAGGGTGSGGHAGPSFGGGNDSVSAVWDGVSTSAPAYTSAVAGTLGAHAHAAEGDAIGSPGAGFTLISYSTTTLAEALANDGSIATTVTLTLRGETFVDDLENKVAITNVPDGLTAVLTHTTETTATLTFTGKAESHANIQDVDNLTVSFQDSAFTGGSAANVFNSVKNDLVIDFNDSPDDVSLAYSTDGFNEARAFDGSVSGEIVITLIGDTFTGSDGDSLLDAATIANIPTGLSAELTRTSATTATLSLAGKAESHADAQDLSDLSLTFKDSAFTNGNASEVGGNGKSDIKIDFSEPLTADTLEFKPHGQGSDASSALALDANYMVVGDDETNELRVYDRKGGDALALHNHAGANSWDYGAALNIDDELDLEAGTRIGNTFYFTGSSGNKKTGADHSSRENLFSVQVTGTGADTTFSGATKLGNDNLEALLVAWDSDNLHGKGADHFGFAAASGAGVIPENVFGFSIEGLTAKADDSNTLLLSFRAPQTGTTGHDDAVIVELNLGDGGSLAGATLGEAYELNLGGRGIRSIEKSATGADYLILAGPAGGTSDEVTHDFRLFRWDGSNAPVELDVDLDTLRDDTGGSFETIVDVQSTVEGTWVQLLQDNGDTVWAGETEVSKDLPGNAQKFLGNWVLINGDVADEAGPQLRSSTPAADANNAQTSANLVLRFDEGVKLGTGAFVIKNANDDVVATINADDASQVDVAFNTVIINPTADLDVGTTYYVEADAGVLEDHYGNTWAGLSGSTALRFTTAAPQPPAQVLITEVNSNAEGGDFFELYNYGTTAVDLTGWKWVDDKASPTDGDAREFTVSQLAAGARLVVITDGTDIAGFREAWGIDASVQVITGATPGPGLGGSGDAVIVFDAAGKVATALNYKTSTLTTNGLNIAPVTRADGEALIPGHAGEAVGASKGVSIVWDGVDPSAPKYQAAIADENGAFAQPDNADNVGSPGAVTDAPPPVDGGDDEPTTPPPPPPPPPAGKPVIVEGSDGNDVIIVPDDQPLTTIFTGGGDDVITGGAGTETVIVPVTLDEVLELGVERNDDGTLVLHTPTGVVTLQDVERVFLSDGHLFALDLELPTSDSQGGHTGQVLAVAFAGLGLVLDESSTSMLSEWVRMADELDDFSAFAQAAIDDVAPGVSDQNLVNHLFWLVTGEFANAEQTAFWVSQLGAGQVYETQGDLLAMVASLPQFTEALTELIGAPQVLLDAAAFEL
jgi:methionine-rich copper-binding protein CopC